MSPGTDVAIVGMAVRCAGARSLQEFWRLLRDGVEAISTFSTDDIEADPLSLVDPSDPNYVRVGSVLDGAESFDASFFGIRASDAARMDPQHRVFIECVWEAMEDAGYDL